MHVLAVDIGTTSIKCALVNDKYEIVSSASTKAVIEYPKKGWAEKDPDVLWKSVVDVVGKGMRSRRADVHG